MQSLTQLPLDRDDLKESWELNPDFQNFEVISSHDSLISVTGASEQLHLGDGRCQTQRKPSRADIQCSFNTMLSIPWKVSRFK